jgi:zinc and cadmium transporter
MLNLQILIASAIVSLISLIGIFTFSSKITRYAKFFVAIATGAMLGDVFFHILPEVLETPDLDLRLIFGFTLLGIMTMFLFESIFRHIHCHEVLEEANHNHSSHSDDHSKDHKHIQNPLGTMNLIGNSLHNFLDGVLIATSFLVSPVAGIATTIAIIIHEIPVEISNFMLLIHSGFTRTKALLYNSITAIFGLLGAVVVIMVGGSFEVVLPYLSSFAAGFLLYISMSDLIPEIHIDHSRRPNYLNFLLIVLAAGFMYWLGILE